MRRRWWCGGVSSPWLAVVFALGLAAGLGGCATNAPPALLGAVPPAQASSGDQLLSNVRALASSSGLTLPATRTQREDALIAQAIAEHEMRNP